jgi:uncharacterized protein YegL
MGLDDFGAVKIAARPLEFIWLLDISGSMQGEKIQSLNFAIREAIPEMQKVAQDNVSAEIFVRSIVFADPARWHMPTRVPIEDFKWKDVTIDGATGMGSAFDLLSEALDIKNMSQRGLPPVLVLVTDGAPTDDAKTSLRRLLEKPWAKKAVKIGIAIGDDADENIIREFINNPELQPLKAHSAGQIVQYIKWASTQVLASASSTKSSGSSSSSQKGNVELPPVPVDLDVEDAW